LLSYTGVENQAMEDLGRRSSQPVASQRTCAVCGLKGHIARGHTAWAEREKRRIEREARRAAKGAAKASISATSRRPKRKARRDVLRRPDIDDSVEEVVDDEQERLDVIGAGDSRDSDEEQGLGSLAGLEPWEESGVESLNPLETRAGVAVRSPEGMQHRLLLL